MFRDAATLERLKLEPWNLLRWKTTMWDPVVAGSHTTVLKTVTAPR